MRSDPRALTSKDISASWLELQYGWAPLLSDVFESAKAYEALTKNKNPTYSQRVFKSKTFTRGGNYGNNLYSGRQKSTASLLIICKYSSPPPPARSLGLTDPASIVWELIPFSFVVDWFIPIGNYLDVINTVPSVLNASFLRSIAQRDTLSFKGISGVHKGSGSTFVHSHTRSLSYSYIVPKPSFKAFDKALSSDHIKNAIALAHQLAF
jgi:hypothetical protein